MTLKLGNCLVLLPVLILISCSSIDSLDVPLCTRVSASKGFCTYLLSPRDQFVDDTHLLNGKTWFDLQPTMIYVPKESWAAIKKYIIKECKRTNRCDNAVESWDRTITVLDAQVNSLSQ
jgi:hypothetical protein